MEMSRMRDGVTERPVESAVPGLVTGLVASPAGQYHHRHDNNRFDSAIAIALNVERAPPCL